MRKVVPPPCWDGGDSGVIDLADNRPVTAWTSSAPPCGFCKGFVKTAIAGRRGASVYWRGAGASAPRRERCAEEHAHSERSRRDARARPRSLVDPRRRGPHRGHRHRPRAGARRGGHRGGRPPRATRLRRHPHARALRLRLLRSDGRGVRHDGPRPPEGRRDGVPRDGAHAPRGGSGGALPLRGALQGARRGRDVPRRPP